MLYLLTFLSLFITATLATLPRSPYGKEDSLKNHPLTKFHRELQSSPKRSMITNFEQGNTFVLANSFANKDCNSDGGQLFESVAFLSGYCIISGSTSQRWTCDSSSVHIEEFDAADCDDSHRSVDSYINIGQCFSTNTTDTTVYNAVSYSCGSSYTPKGSWYSSLYFSDSGCKNPVEAVSILNGYCLSPDQKMSYKYDYPKESYYFSNPDCTGAVTTFDISSSANVCFPVSASSSLNSYETLFVKN